MGEEVGGCSRGVQTLAEDLLGHGNNYANYLSYLGSLMHPPCTEGVSRILLKVSLCRPLAAPPLP